MGPIPRVAALALLEPPTICVCSPASGAACQGGVAPTLTILVLCASGQLICDLKPPFCET